jgi:hypothetical protein
MLHTAADVTALGVATLRGAYLRAELGLATASARTRPERTV